MRMQLTLRNGAHVEVDVDEFTTTKNAMNGLTGIKWTTSDGWMRKLHFIEVEQVVAIVAIQPFNDDIQP